jgi:hypothetical protein
VCREHHPSWRCQFVRKFGSRLGISFLFVCVPIFLINLFLKRQLYDFIRCGRSFELVLELNDRDLNLVQQAVTSAVEFPELQYIAVRTVAYSSDVMTEHQRELFGYDRWYQEMLDRTVFGAEEQPIIIED